MSRDAKRSVVRAHRRALEADGQSETAFGTQRMRTDKGGRAARMRRGGVMRMFDSRGVQLTPAVNLSGAVDMCFQKSAFPSQIAAEEKAARIVADNGPHLRAYACPVCTRWHLTSQPKYQIRGCR